MKTCDIIIPAYNSAHTLPDVLQAITQQELPLGYTLRVILCDDGSTDTTREVASNAPAQLEVRYISGKHKGAAQARNRGIDVSDADLLLFLGADIILRPGAIAAHIDFHNNHPKESSAALGFVVWDPRLSPTPLMEWMTHGGPQNDFDAFLGGASIDISQFFYGSHVSVKREFLGSDRFSTTYDGYGYEDIELGRQLAARGGTLHPLPDAMGLHRHMYDVTAIAARQRAVGRNSRIFHGGKVNMVWKHKIQAVVYAAGVGALIKATIMALAGRYACPRLFGHYINYEFRRGLVHSKHMSSPQPFPQ